VLLKKKRKIRACFQVQLLEPNTIIVQQPEGTTLLTEKRNPSKNILSEKSLVDRGGNALTDGDNGGWSEVGCCVFSPRIARDQELESSVGR
jgi:hypothetical protein